jgi:starch phosphorylase
MAEALEKWDLAHYFDVIPEVYPYVVMLDNRFGRELAKRGIPKADREQYRFVSGGRVHMARMAIYSTHSTNGVAQIHSDLLKTDALKEWYELFPERFNNKTNGITQRRWLALCNPALSGFITNRIGDGWIRNLDELEKLLPLADDNAALDEFATIKRQNKVALCDYIKQTEGVALNPDFIFDIHVKRLHEYKRQFLNALSILDLYFRIKDGSIGEFYPTAFLFGAKAFPSYMRAKAILKLVNEIARLIAKDPAVRDKL